MEILALEPLAAFLVGVGAYFGVCLAMVSFLAPIIFQIKK